MFRAEIRWLTNGTTLKMEGTLVRDWAEQARSLVTKDVVPEGLIVDLTELSDTDFSGEQLLKWLGAGGAEFVAGNVYMKNVCERLRLPILEHMPARPWKHEGEGLDYTFTYGLKPVPAT